jgi:flagellar hook protein FlgE
VNTILNTALGGMAAASRAIQAAATHIANVNTDGYRTGRRGPHAPALPDPTGAAGMTPPGPPPSDVDLAEEFVEILRQEVGYRASAALVRVADRMMGERLDAHG